MDEMKHFQCLMRLTDQLTDKFRNRTNNFFSSLGRHTWIFFQNFELSMLLHPSVQYQHDLSSCHLQKKTAECSLCRAPIKRFKLSFWLNSFAHLFLYLSALLLSSSSLLFCYFLLLLNIYVSIHASNARWTIVYIHRFYF